MIMFSWKFVFDLKMPIMHVPANWGSFMFTFSGSIRRRVRGRDRTTGASLMSVNLILRAVCFSVAT